MVGSAPIGSVSGRPVLASLLPQNADRSKFLHVIGIHGDPVAAKKRIAAADKAGERLGAAAYGYPRAFKYGPSQSEIEWLTNSVGGSAAVLDPTAGGGSIPFEATRLGLEVHANDLNPVAALIERATIAWPKSYRASLKEALDAIGLKLTATVKERLASVFPEEPSIDTRPDGYLWARTISCQYCDATVPLSPNWRLASGRHRCSTSPQLL